MKLKQRLFAFQCSRAPLHFRHEFLVSLFDEKLSRREIDPTNFLQRSSRPPPEVDFLSNYSKPLTPIYPLIQKVSCLPDHPRPSRNVF